MAFNPQFARLGEILVHEGYVTEDQVKEALIKQSNFGLKLGETMKTRLFDRGATSQSP